MGDLITLFALIVGGGFAMGAVVGLAMKKWADNALSCAEVLVISLCLLLFLAIWTIPGGFPWNLIFLVAPVLYIGLSQTVRGSQRRLLRQLRRQDIDSCERLLARDPRNAAAHAKLGQMLEQDGRWREALQAFEQALQLEPGETVAKSRFKVLQERLALQESGQVKCPHCLTVQPKQQGICWKCGRVFDERRAFASRMARLGWRGYLAVIGAVICLALFILSAMTITSGHYVSLFRWICIGGLLLTIGILTWLIRALLAVMADEGGGWEEE